MAMTVGLRSIVYPISGSAENLLTAGVEFDDLARLVRCKISEVLRCQPRPDPTAEKDALLTLLFLNVLEGKSTEAISAIARLRSLSEKPSVRLTAHLAAECAVLAMQNDEDRHGRFREALEAIIRPLPWSVVDGEIRRLRSDVEILTEALLDGLVHANCKGTHVEDAPLDHDMAAFVIRMRFYKDVMLPFRDDMRAVLDQAINAHAGPSASIWKTRSVDLPEVPLLEPVVIGVWDSGIEMDLFQGRVATSEGRGCLAWDSQGQPADGALLPLSPKQRHDYPTMVDLVRGFGEARVGTRSPLARAFERKMAALDSMRVTAFLEELEQVADYVHGTHVAGVAVAGNPFAKLLSVRITWEQGFTVATAVAQDRLDAQINLYRRSIRFLQRGGARVVNISWNRFPSLYTGRSGPDGSNPRVLFEKDRNALHAAMAEATDVLFVVACGNSDQNVTSGEIFPAAFDLPNLIVAAAADEAGNAATFSNFGAPKMVYAPGCNIFSVVPGGREMPMSGTSVAAAEVTNLAGKIFALNPSLVPSQAIDAIVSGSSVSIDGRRFIDARKTLSSLAAGYASPVPGASDP